MMEPEIAYLRDVAISDNLFGTYRIAHLSRRVVCGMRFRHTDLSDDIYCFVCDGVSNNLPGRFLVYASEVCEASSPIGSRYSKIRPGL